MNHIKSLLAAVMLCSTVLGTEAKGRATEPEQSIPVTHILVCCRSANDGARFLVNGKFVENHDYGDIEQCRDILQKIKDAGINTISVDFTNPSQWDLPTKDSEGEDINLYYKEFFPMLDNVAQVCKEKDMTFFIFLGNTRAWTMKYWNEIAKKVWDNYAHLPNYHHYGFGDDRPMLLIFLPGLDFQQQWAETPDNEKNYLAKFRIGTTQVNDPILPVESDGWGYRNYSQSSDGKVRFCAPNSGVPQADWKRIDAKEWAKRVNWAGQADHYTVFGSWDDTCDGIFWGIADCSDSRREYHRNPETLSDPYAYYNVVKDYLHNRKPASKKKK